MSRFRPRASGALALLLLAAMLAAAGCGGDNSTLVPEADEPLFRDGLQKQREGQIQAALADFLRVIVKRGDQAPESHLDAGLIYQDYDPIAAIYHFHKYIELEPNSRQVSNVRGLIDTAERNFARTLPLVTAGMEGAAGHSDLLEQVNRLQSENDELKARLVSLRGEDTPSIAIHSAADAGPALPPVFVARAPDESAAVVAPVAPEPAAIATAPVAAPRPRPAPAAPPPARPEHGRSYTVQAGDTLYRIAKKVYGTATAGKVRAIRDANRGVLSSAGALKPGMELKMP
jgi:phage tail protein X